MKSKLLSTIFLGFVLATQDVAGFNVETRSADIYSGPQQNQLFGYSVALHGYGAKHWLLVGAPLSNVTSSTGPGTLEKYGTIYKCEYGTGSKSCTEIEVDHLPMKTKQITAGNRTIILETEKKSGQWLGATLHSTGQDGSVVTCAPRYIFAPHTRADRSVRFQYHSLLGRCFPIRKDLKGTQEKVLSPCRQFGLGTNFGYCQAGFSAEYTADGRDLAMGAVGKGIWRGSLIAYSTSEEKFAFSPTNLLQKADYMGYAVTSGNFTGQKLTEFVGGAPRANRINGKVVIFTRVNTEIQVTSVVSSPKGIPVGSYFGSSLCAVDLNNDGYSDLLVGAPRAQLKDEGRVFVYVNNKQSALNLQDSLGLMGDNQPYAQFGRAIARVGDLNKDGFQDVAVGAPYEGEDGSGAVYIYHGSDKGINPIYTQKLKASSVDAGLRTFGSAISGGVDMDGNTYPDIAVGSYGSNKAVLFRTRPIVNIEGSIHLSENQIVLENNDSMCTLDGKTRYKCLNLTVCFRNKDKVVTTPAGLEISYTLDLDRSKAVRGSDSFRRMFFVDDATKEKPVFVSDFFNVTEPGKSQCSPPITVYLKEKDKLGDVGSSLTFDLSYGLKTSCASDLCPLLNDSIKTTHTARAFFMKRCKNHRVCEPDLAVNGTVILTGYDSNRTVSRHLRIGLVRELILQLTVSNLVVDYAYYAKVVLKYPRTLEYQRTNELQCEDNILENRTQSERSLSCDVARPALPGLSNKTLEIKFSAITVEEDFTITATAESQDPDANIEDNSKEFFVAVKYEADLEVKGYSKPDQVIYSGPTKPREKVEEFQEEIGPEIIQTVKVTNYGPSVVDGSQVTITVPTLLGTDKPDAYLIYLLQVEVLGPGSCSAVVNPLNIQSKAANRSVHTKNSRRDTRDVDVMRMDCSLAECKSFQCSLGRLKLGDKVEIRLTSRLWQNTLLKLEKPVTVELETIARVSPPTKVMQPNEDNDVATITLTAKPVRGKGQSKHVPWWVYLVSVLGGIMLLAGAVFVLYKVGFFKRKTDKFSLDAEETVPMNSGANKS